jgi:hypothetical protein
MPEIDTATTTSHDDEGVAPSSTRSSPEADTLHTNDSAAPNGSASDEEHDYQHEEHHHDHHDHHEEHEESLLQDGEDGDVTNGKLEQRRIDVLAVKLAGFGSPDEDDESEDEAEEKDKKRMRGKGPPETQTEDGGQTVEANRFICVC